MLLTLPSLLASSESELQQLLQPLVRISIVLSIAWLLHHALKRANPQLRVLLWRTTTVGLFLVALASLQSYHWNLPLLPAVSTSTSRLAETPNHSVDNMHGPLVVSRSDAAVAEAPTAIAVPESVGTAASQLRIEQHPHYVSTAEPVGATRMTINLSQSLLVVWLLGFVAISFSWLASLYRGASPLPRDIAREARAIASRIDYSATLNIRHSANIDMPCTIGLWTPCILLPSSQCNLAARDERQASLAHELGHCKRHDLRWNHLLALLQAVLWFHPLAWKIRLAHTDACDELCDTIAARCLGNATLYGRLLAAVAVRAASRQAASALAMARRSQVRIRIEAVQHNLARRAIGFWQAGTISVSALLVVLLLGTVGITRAEPPVVEQESLDETVDSLVPSPFRFPVTRFEVEEPESDVNPNDIDIAILDDADPTFDPDKPHHDTLRVFDTDGDLLWSHTGLNSIVSVGGVHGVAIDRQRGRVYVCEPVSKRITAFNLAGTKIWQIDGINAECLAVDGKTGDIWCSGGNSLSSGETVVFNMDGFELPGFPHRAIDMAYDPHTDAFWLVGFEVVKLTREGTVLFREPVNGWICASVSVDPNTGNAWIAERRHSQEADSRSHLWCRGPDGTVRRELSLGADHLFVVECEPKSGDAFFSGYLTGLRRVSLEGDPQQISQLNAKSIEFSPVGNLWVTTTDAIQRIDEQGKVLESIPFSQEPSPEEKATSSLDNHPTGALETSANVESTTATNSGIEIAILDNTDPTFMKDQPHHDYLRTFNRHGDELWSQTDLNNAETVGGVHGVVVDRQRGRIYIRENVAGRVSAFDLAGTKLWHLDGVNAGCLAIDQATGHLWCGGSTFSSGNIETVVIDLDGKQLAAYPFAALDMAYDPTTDAFWLVGPEVIKLAKDGEVLFRESMNGWCYASVSIDPNNGNVWIAERKHTYDGKGKSSLWCRKADGTILREINLESDDLFVVECDPTSGEAYFSGYNTGLRRVSLDGDLQPVSALSVKNISITPSGDIWIATTTAAMQINEYGKVLQKLPFSAKSPQAWIATF
ncbi:M56 family metallopeptidase [Aeoliella mucimassa]|uniref:Regulatory protein BlaR1 n=1 Tax=Aeoliella mucimassa TaxID=2527972 RepID=A0A518AGT3_9BACT|nr:M56 family metallopeptidase [Aeoliella mucimassa]QDU53909.1 Regulatory protein BlaR1 [Aeoliella mucimassa]